MGLATNIEEYVPTTIPTINDKDKSRKDSPPKTNIAATTKNVAKLVNIVLESVWFKLWLTIALGLSPCFAPAKRSLIRAKITMVSLIEYPNAAIIAQITLGEISILVIAITAKIANG